VIRADRRERLVGRLDDPSDRNFPGQARLGELSVKDAGSDQTRLGLKAASVRVGCRHVLELLFHRLELLGQNSDL
jgi:hypothetical protein